MLRRAPQSHLFRAGPAAPRAQISRTPFICTGRRSDHPRSIPDDAPPKAAIRATINHPAQQP
jgi:hypothetical protein